MRLSRRDLLKQGSMAVGLLGLGSLQARAEQASNRDPILHFLNRLSYGVRPEEVARARDIGLEAYLEEQLDPESLSDEEAARLANFPLLNFDRKTIYSLQNAQGRCYQTLITTMILRAVHSRKQLLERMVEFWSDHFNIPADFDITPDIVLFQREVIRKHALGNFRDLLFGSAQSPAMLYYLDNASNIAEHPNENWARELLELYTLGVDGGYSEDDVKEIAKAFTGWTIHDRTETGFYFREDDHDKNPKVVLGHLLPENRGIEDGLHVLSILTKHPSTAKFICLKLCRRFVSDQPPESLVDHLSKVFLEERGEIKPILRALFLSSEFQASAGQKLRRPLDFFIGALRASGTEINEWWQLEEILTSLGQTPYGWHPPDGYPDVAAAWTNTAGLLARWNAAMRLTHGSLSDYDYSWGVSTALHERIPEVETVSELVQEVSKQVFGDVLANDLLEPFIHYASDGAGGQEPVTIHLRARKLASLYGLMLASPQYQWR